MKKLILLMSLCLVLLAFPALSQEGNQSEAAMICDYQQGKLEEGGALPDGAPFKNERINAYTPENESIGHIVTEDGIATSLGCATIEDPTFIMTIESLSVLEEIEAADSQVNAFDDALGSGDIVMDGVGFAKSMKSGFIRASVKVMSWFS